MVDLEDKERTPARPVRLPMEQPPAVRVARQPPAERARQEFLPPRPHPPLAASVERAAEAVEVPAELEASELEQRPRKMGSPAQFQAGAGAAVIQAPLATKAVRAGAVKLS